MDIIGKASTAQIRDQDMSMLLFVMVGGRGWWVKLIIVDLTEGPLLGTVQPFADVY